MFSYSFQMYRYAKYATKKIYPLYPMGQERVWRRAFLQSMEEYVLICKKWTKYWTITLKILMSAFNLVLQEKVKGNILAVQRMVSHTKKKCLLIFVNQSILVTKVSFTHNCTSK